MEEKKGKTKGEEADTFALWEGKGKIRLCPRPKKRQKLGTPHPSFPGARKKVQFLTPGGKGKEGQKSGSLSKSAFGGPKGGKCWGERKSG